METDIKTESRDYSSISNRSLDDIIKESRPQRKNLRHHKKINNDNDNNPTPTTTTNSISVLESSLSSIVKFNKSNHVKKTQQYNSNSKPYKQQSQDGGVNQNIKVVIRNDGVGHNLNNNSELFQNRGLFSRNSPKSNVVHHHHHHQRSHNHHHHHNSNNRSPIQQQFNRPQIIDHKLFDPRGIKDYSQVKRPTHIIGNGRVIDAEERDDYDENIYRIRVKNLPPTTIGSDVASLFSPFGSLRDFDLNKELREASVIFRKKLDAISAIERYNNVELDNYQLTIEKAFIIKKADKEDIIISVENERVKNLPQESQIDTQQQQQQPEEEEGEQGEEELEDDKMME